jgi:site-specific DNA-methyltransferase (adenine-specific)
MSDRGFDGDPTFRLVPPGAAVHPTRSAPTFRVHRQDAVTWLSSLADQSVDLVVTDPAYESLEKYRAVGTTTRLKRSRASSNDWFAIFPDARFPALFAELYRVLRKDRHLYLYCDQATLFVVKPIAEQVGFKFWKALVWDKELLGMGYHYRSRHELILFFEKGKRKLSDLSVADVIRHPRVRGGYPAEKPVAVSEVLVRQSSEAGDLVIDPFTGSGSVGAAAVGLGRHFLGTDVCAEAVTAAEARLAEAGAEADDCMYDAIRR